MDKNARQRFTLDTDATIYGCCGLFDLCADAALMSLSFEGQNRFLDWLGWEPSLVCDIKKAFIAWTRPEYSQGAATSGVVSDPCADDYGAEWGVCDFTLHDFGRLRRHGPVRDITMTNVRLCDNQPRYRLDGSPINDDREYDMRVATEAVLQDLKRRVILGNAANAGDFSGLEHLVITGYTNANGSRCELMDSILINMAGNGMNGGAGMTWNGAAINAAFGFIDILIAVYRRIMQRISWSPQLASQTMQVGDMALVLPTNLIRCILDAYTCWSVCSGAQYNEVSIQSYEARTYRNSLNGGMFGFGRIFLDSFEIPLIGYDWGLIKGPTLNDAYLLTNKIGNMRLINGQYNDMRAVVADRPDRYQATDGGRLLTWADDDMTCEQRHVEFRPRLLMWAPWAQARFYNVSCRQPAPVMSPDPTETSFFPDTSFNEAACP